MGIAYRISQEINNKAIILSIYNIYIRPIIEYAAPIWRHCSKKDVETLDRFHRRVTKTALNIPRRTDHPNYLPYESRCIALLQLSPKTKFQLSCAMFVITAMKSYDEIAVNRIIKQAIAPPRRYLRHAHLFDLQYQPSTKRTSILHKCMTITEAFAMDIDLSKSKQTIKSDIMKHLFNT